MPIFTPGEMLLAVAIAMTVGFAFGYGLRSIVEYSRRQRFLRERGW